VGALVVDAGVGEFVDDGAFGDFSAVAAQGVEAHLVGVDEEGGSSCCHWVLVVWRLRGDCT